MFNIDFLQYKIFTLFALCLLEPINEKQSSSRAKSSSECMTLSSSITEQTLKKKYPQVLNERRTDIRNKNDKCADQELLSKLLISIVLSALI
jgi:hypothetical protein